jgi:hypothetical protein
MTTAAAQVGQAVTVEVPDNAVGRRKNGREPEEIEINGQRHENVEMFK